MTAGDSKAALTITPQPALAPSPQPRPAPTARALPPGLVAQVGQNWTPIVGQNWMPIDNSFASWTVASLLDFQLELAFALRLGQAQAGTRCVVPCYGPPACVPTVLPCLGGMPKRKHC